MTIAKGLQLRRSRSKFSSKFTALSSNKSRLEVAASMNACFYFEIRSTAVANGKSTDVFLNEYQRYLP